DRGHFRVAVGHPRDPWFVDHAWLESCDLLGHEDALLETTMRQLQSGHEIADRVHAGQVGTEPVVGADEATLHRESVLFVAESRRVGSTADSNQQQICIERFAVLQRHAHTVVVLRRTGELHTGLERNLPFAEGTLELLGGELVLVRHESGECFHDGDVSAEGRPYAGELDTDHTATEYDNLVRYVVQRQRLFTGHDSAAEFDTGKGFRVGSAGQQQVLSGVTGPVDIDAGSTGEGARTFDHVEASALEQALQALVRAADNVVLVCGHAGHVHAVKACVDTELGGFLGGVGDLGGMQQGLRGNTTAVQAGAADLVLFDEGDGHTEFGGP